MNPRTLLNIILLAAIVVLVLFVIFEPGKKAPETPSSLTDLSVDKITSIAIENDNKPAVQLEKRDKNWFLTAPYQMPANNFRVQSLLQIAGAESHAQFSSNAHDLKKFHLGHPKAVLRLNDTSISFGDTEPLTLRRYVLVGSTIHLIKDNVFHQLTQNATSFISLALLPEASIITRLTLPDMTLQKDRNNAAWTLEPNPKGQVSMDQINKLIDAWTSAQALAVEPYKSGTTKPKTKAKVNQNIEVSLASGNVIKFEVRPDETDLPLSAKKRLTQIPPATQTQ
jgi:hypothetical protein